MAILKFDTFPADTEGAGLLKKVRQAMTNLSGHGQPKTGPF